MKKYFYSILIVALAACGGGGGGGGGGGNSTGSGNGSAVLEPGALQPSPGGQPVIPAPASDKKIFSYELKMPVASTRSQIEAEFNKNGSEGRRFLGRILFANNDQKYFYTHTPGETYNYEVLPDPKSQAELNAQLNQQGRRSYRLLTLLADLDGAIVLNSGAAYVKANNLTETYQYRLAVIDINTGRLGDSAIAQLNQEGNAGWRHLAFYNVGSSTVGVFEKVDGSLAKYSYEAIAAPATEAEHFAQFQMQGQKGYRFGFTTSLNNTATTVFVKDLTQQATYSYIYAPVTEDTSLFTQNAIAAGLNGGAWLGPVRNFRGKPYELYFQSSTCSGVLCELIAPVYSQLQYRRSTL